MKKRIGIILISFIFLTGFDAGSLSGIGLLFKIQGVEDPQKKLSKFIEENNLDKECVIKEYFIFLRTEAVIKKCKIIK